MFGPYRIKVGMKTRRPHERPSHLPLQTKETKGTSRTIDVPASEHPSGILLIHFQPPRLLSQKPPSVPGEIVQVGAWVHMPDAAAIGAAFARQDTRSFALGHFDELMFARLLAKIACAFAVAEKDLPIRPSHDIVRLILGQSKSFDHFIGASPEPMPKVPNVAHKLGWKTASNSEATYLLATVQLFAYLGAPEYEIIVAEKAPPELARVQ